MPNSIRVVGRVAGDPTLRRVGFGYLCFAVAEHAVWMAGLLYAYDRGGVGEAGLVAVLLLLPSIVVGPVAAYAADRYPTGRVLAITYGVQSTSMLATGVGIAVGAPAVLVYLGAMVAATAVAPTRPAIGALLPAVTHTPADLTAANVTVGFVENVGMFVGPALAGFLVAAVGLGSPFVVCGVLAGVAVAMSIGLPLDTTPSEADDDRSAIGDTMEGLRTLRADRPVRLMIGMIVLGGLVTGAADVLFVATADHVADGETSRAGLFGMVFGIGALVGALVSVGLVGRARLTPWIATGVATLGLSLGVLAAAESIWSAVVLYAAMGAGESLMRVSTLTLIQRVAPPAVIGRYLGVAEGLQSFALAAGAGAIGLLVARVGYREGLIMAGIAVSLVLLARLPRLFRVDRDAVAPDERLLELMLGDDIFESLPAPIIERLAADASRRTFVVGETPVREGEPGDHYFIVDSGGLALTIDGTEIAVLGPGDSFGELALLHDTPRTATATALDDSVLVEFQRETFLQAVTGHPRSRAIGRGRVDRYLGND